VDRVLEWLVIDSLDWKRKAMVKGRGKEKRN